MAEKPSAPSSTLPAKKANKKRKRQEVEESSKSEAASTDKTTNDAEGPSAKKRKRNKDKYNKNKDKKKNKQKQKPKQRPKQKPEEVVVKEREGKDGIDESISKMDGRLLADHVMQKAKRHNKDLTAVELNDLSVPEQAFLDTTSFESRTLAQLPAFLKAFSPEQGAGLSKASEEKGCPHTLVVTSAGLRAADLVRALRSFQNKEAIVAKLFAKHIKLDEAKQFLKRARVNIGVGTPMRIIDLIESGTLKTQELERIVIDGSHIDQKKRGIFDMKETHFPLLQLLTRPEFRERSNPYFWSLDCAARETTPLSPIHPQRGSIRVINPASVCRGSGASDTTRRATPPHAATNGPPGSLQPGGARPSVGSGKVNRMQDGSELSKDQSLARNSILSLLFSLFFAVWVLLLGGLTHVNDMTLASSTLETATVSPPSLDCPPLRLSQSVQQSHAIAEADTVRPRAKRHSDGSGKSLGNRSRPLQQPSPPKGVKRARMDAPDSPPKVDEPLQVDSDVSDGTSTLNERSTIVSSIRNYTYENGRRYHSYRAGQYLLPNDDREQDRLDLGHHIFKLILDGELFRAPIEPRCVLDIGTGTGLWAIDLADEYPDAEVIGLDLSPIQPSWVPPNCRFEVDDAESEWLFAQRGAFDFIHGRAMSGSIGDWQKLFNQAYDHLRPGGWLELQEYETQATSDDDTIDQAVHLKLWQDKINEASQIFGKPFMACTSHKQRMLDAGFVDVTQDTYKVPMGTWPKNRKLKELGRFQLLQMIEAVEPFSLAVFTRILKWTPEATRELMERVKADLCNPRLHLYSRFHFIYGRKPEKQ